MNVNISHVSFIGYIGEMHKYIVPTCYLSSYDIKRKVR